MMSVIVEPKVEAKTQELFSSFVFVPVHMFRWLLCWRELKGLSGVPCLSSWKQFSYEVPIYLFFS